MLIIELRYRIRRAVRWWWGVMVAEKGHSELGSESFPCIYQLRTSPRLVGSKCIILDWHGVVLYSVQVALCVCGIVIDMSESTSSSEHIVSSIVALSESICEKVGELKRFHDDDEESEDANAQGTKSY